MSATPQIIAFVSQTGNVMKTTLAAAVGVALAEAQVPVLAIDLDPEHRVLGASLETWANQRAATFPDRPQLPVTPADNAEEALKVATTAQAQIVLIDCPSRATEATAHICAAADFVIHPLVPGAKDAVLTVVTLGRIIAAGIPPERLGVILTRVGTDAEARDWKRWLANIEYHDGAGITVIQADIPERTAYRSTIGKGLSILEAPAVAVRRPARAAVNEIIETFMRITAQEAA